MSRTVAGGTVNGAAPVVRRVAAQGAFELRAVLRNGEQVMVTVLLPLILLAGLARATFVTVDTGGATRIDLVTPGVLAFALMSSAFTSPAIATAFDRRARCAPVPTRDGELAAYAFVLDPTAELAAVPAELEVARISTGARFRFRDGKAELPLLT